jgi:hypothetical protein
VVDGVMEVGGTMGSLIGRVSRNGSVRATGYMGANYGVASGRYSRRDRTAESKRITDGKHPIPDARWVVSKPHIRKFVPALTLISARSVSGSAPITLAGYIVPLSVITSGFVPFART